MTDIEIGSNYMRWGLTWSERKSLRCGINLLNGMLRGMELRHIDRILVDGTEISYEGIEQIRDVWQIQLQLSKGIELPPAPKPSHEPIYGRPHPTSVNTENTP